MIINEIKCACGCKKVLTPTDKWGRPRRYISGHNGRKYSNPTQYKREWNHRNRLARQLYKKLYHRKRKIKLLSYKGNACEHCGIKYNGKNAAIFHFHHLYDKKFNIGNQVLNKAWATLIKEVDKCLLLCANCHEMQHGEDF
jgi:hypothetical protein